MDPQGELRPGDVFAGHRIEGVAGRGGMGVVYRATALDLDRIVALKLVAPALGADAGFRDRFIRESRVAASLDHPNVIPVFYAGEDAGRLYLAMRYVDGDDLRTLIRRELRLAAPRAARIVAQIGSALDAAHARGIVHRDVKPANVLLAPGDHAYLTDFGLTKRLHTVAAETRPGGWVGSLGYVAPEQIRGEPLDARADVYALGCVLFHALTGATPYARDSDEATLWAHLNDPPPSIGPQAPGAPPGFDAVVERALAKRPEDRYPSAGDLGRAALAAASLEAPPDGERAVAVGGAARGAAGAETRTSPTAAAVTPPTPTRPAPAGVTEERPPRDRRRTGLAVAAGLALIAVGGGLALVLGGGGDGAAPAPPQTTTAAVAPRRPAPVSGRVGARIPVGSRPNALAIAEGRLWVSSSGETRLRVIDLRTNRPSGAAPKVGIGTNALDAGYDSVWVAKATTQSLLRYSAASARRTGPPTPLPAGIAVAVAAGERAVWVGSRAKGGDPAALQTVARVDPASGTLTEAPRPQPDGVQDLAVGDGALWVLARRRAVVTRIDIATGLATRTQLGGDPQRIAIGQGSVWISNDDGTVTQIGLRKAVRRRIPVGAQPRGLAVGSGAVWVANSLDGTVTRIDARTGRKVGAPVEVGSNPSAVIVRGRSAWVSLLGDNEVARVDFTP